MNESNWNGASLSQEEMMETDTVIAINDQDDIIGSASKKESHIFGLDQPRGILHRAFSVFLFDDETGELLLQQRASSKITFPNVWTNTCCSHPLHGMHPNEVDTSCLDGKVPGIKTAACRKLKQELGIPLSELDPSQFQFITRLHYWAADSVTHGPESPWGEHEIDYVLLYTIPNKKSITVTPNPEEVDDIKWVSQQALLSMLQDKSLLFSPWFRIIVQKWFLGPQGWWTNLKDCMTTDKYRDYQAIHRFDPPKEHLGGAGNAGPIFTLNQQNDSQKAKQGAYGKVKIHRESKVSQLLRLDEVWSAVTFLYLKPLRSNLNSEYIQKTYPSSELQFCDAILVKVSRSFAAVIRQLPNTLLVDVMIFYLVLRALDTIEDDTTAFPSHIVKVEHLTDFYKRALYDSQWTLDGVGEGDERRLLQQFSNCQIIFSKLRPNSRAIIADITERMALGMAEFVDKDMGQGTKDIVEYNRYCHFVAGLVGEGLSRLFAASGLERPELATEIRLSDQMGLFLQKVNIIRDYLEDYVDGRAWWPQSIWKQHSPTGDLGYFTNQENPEVRTRSLKCLHDLVTDALELAPDCLAYMSSLRCAEIFRFCAIPQVMAIATLDALYGNPDVFTGVVKLRKGLSCKLMLHSNSIPELHTIFHLYASSIARKADILYKEGTVDIASWQRVKTLCQDLMERTHSTRIRSRSSSLQFILFVMIGALITLEVLKRSNHNHLFENWGDNLVKVVQGIILIIASLIFLSSSHHQSPHARLQTAMELTSQL